MPENYWIFIYSYLPGICLLVFLTRGGSLFSLNRFVLSTIFGGIFIIHLAQILRNFYLPWILLSFLIILNGYSHIKHILVQLPIFLPFIFLAFFHKKWSKIFLILIFIGFQLFFMQKFMLGLWVA